MGRKEREFEWRLGRVLDARPSDFTPAGCLFATLLVLGIVAAVAWGAVWLGEHPEYQPSRPWVGVLAFIALLWAIAMTAFGGIRLAEKLGLRVFKRRATAPGPGPTVSHDRTVDQAGRRSVPRGNGSRDGREPPAAGEAPSPRQGPAGRDTRRIVLTPYGWTMILGAPTGWGWFLIAGIVICVFIPCYYAASLLVEREHVIGSLLLIPLSIAVAVGLFFGLAHVANGTRFQVFNPRKPTLFDVIAPFIAIAMVGLAMLFFFRVIVRIR